MRMLSFNRKQILDYFVLTLNGMAYGLFATLIIGVILGQLATLIGSPEPLITLSNTLKGLMGAGIGLGIGMSLKKSGLHLIALTTAGAIATAVVSGLKDPSVAYVSVITTALAMDFVLRKKTPLDILLIPLFGALVSFGVTLLIGPSIGFVISSFGELINQGTYLAPLLMGIVVSVLMGIALTAPISSAAIAIALGLNGLAAGAALAGCSAQMIGFAVMSRRDNSLGTTLSVAFGTSMLQFKNIVKKPLLWLPTIIVSAITGPLATLVFQAEADKIGAGMGTSGLVGQLSTLATMEYSVMAWMTVLVLHLVIPILLTLIIEGWMIRKGWIQKGDLTI